ncbi:sporulation protein [Kitasatospora sp. NPDC051914]|uniref:sporulation protein n=1 Tax=Kitasatospora sp. NPDC051914 TaxID=3154945 RepID=UPI0034123066
MIGIAVDHAAGAERQVPFAGRLPWGCSFTEVGGQALGVDFSLQTRIKLKDSPTELVDLDFLHVEPLPVVQAVLDAFAELGYLERHSEVMDGRIADTEQYLHVTQTVFVTDPGGGRGDLSALELAFHTNPVGTICHVRRAAQAVYTWEDKPDTVWFPAAHHEVGHADLTARAAKALADLELHYSRPPRKGRRRPSEED